MDPMGISKSSHSHDKNEALETPNNIGIVPYGAIFSIAYYHEGEVEYMNDDDRETWVASQ